jgi:hypothetical protein
MNDSPGDQLPTNMDTSASNRPRRGPNKRALAVFAGFILAFALIFAWTEDVFAIDNPDTINIDAVRAYGGVLQPGDLLIVVEYTLSYASLPDEIISDAYLARFLRGTTPLNQVEPFAFNDKGYGVGILSMYWTAAQKNTDSIEFDDTNSEGYQINLQGKPGVFSGSAPTTTTGTIIWTDITDTKLLLFNDVRSFALRLGNIPEWNNNDDFDVLVNQPGGTAQLNTAGEDYFSNAIPQLQSMIPLIFSSGVSSPSFVDDTLDTAFKDDLDKFWDGNWVDTRFQNLADRYRAPKHTITTLFALFFMGLIAWYVATQLLDGDDTSWSFGMLTLAVTLPMATAVNWIPLDLAIVVAFVALLGLAWALLARRAGN